MNHPELNKTLGLVLAAAAFAGLAPAAEDRSVGPGPRPGLEVFDGGTRVQPPAMRYPPEQMVDATGTATAPLQDETATDQGQAAQQPRRPLEGQRADLYGEPVITPQSQQPPYRAPDVRRPPVARPRPAETGAAEIPGFDDPFANLGEGPARPDYGPPRQPLPAQSMTPLAPLAPMTQSGPPPGRGPVPMPNELPAAPYRPPPPPPPPMPEYSAIETLNVANPHFPGLADAVRANHLPGASQIIWNTLRQRQMQGLYGFTTIMDPGALTQALTMTPPVAEDPLLAAQRVNVVIDAFQSPTVASPSFAGMMPQILTRLNGDIFTVQRAMANYTDEGVFLELARTYVRAVTTCDFIAFPRRQTAADIRYIANRGMGMFYPDGSSRAGDVAGVTGNLFHILFMLDRYGRDDGGFRRDIGPISRMLETPGSFLSAVACPDGSLPNFGPRGTRELQPLEMRILQDQFPRMHVRQHRIGLAGTRSFPFSSRDRNYSGIYVMRDNDGRLGRYLAMRLGPLGELMGVPAHADFGSLVLMSRGVKYLSDPGGYGGQAAAPMTHGGLSLDGRYVTPDSYPPPGEPSNAVWRTNASVDYATGSGVFPDNKRWQRSVVYLKDLPGETKTDYWVVLDNVDMRDAPEPAVATIRFPLAPGVTAQREGPGILMTGSSANGAAMRVYAVDSGVRLGVGDAGLAFDATGGAAPTPSIMLQRELTGSATTATVFYPSDDRSHRPLRIERDADIIRGRTGVVVVDHGMERLDVIAWAPPGTELVTPTLNLQMSADLGVFRIRRGKIARVDFVNLERFQAKEPDGGLWSMRVNGPSQSLTIEKEFGGGWQILSDPDNRGSANFEDVNLGPTMTGRRFSIRPGELRPVW